MNAQPEFISKMDADYKQGLAHGFVIHNNVNDYVAPGVTLKTYLTQYFANLEVVVFYNRSQGLTFPLPSMEKRFREITGLSGQAAQAANPALAALQASRGQAGQGEPQLPTSPEAVLPLIETFLKSVEPQTAAVVIEYAESIAPAADLATMTPGDRTTLVTLSRWGRDSELESQGQFVVLVTESIDQLADQIKAASSKYSLIEISYPNQAARKEFIEWYLAAKPVELELTTQEFANLTAGLNCMHIEDIVLRGQAEGQITAQIIKDRKDSIIKSEFADVLEVLDPAGGFECVGGLGYIKEYFRKSVINPMRVGNWGRVPMGTLMMGPAGTGKSIMAEAVAHEAKINAVKLNIGGQIASKWQGEGERKLAKALRGILNFAPTLVFIDEIDQVVSRGSGDNQQESRIFQMLLEFMSDTDHRGQVVILAATNRPDLMDAALRRAGRFDDKIAFLVPDSGERQAIFEVFANKFDLGNFNIPAEAITSTEGYTGAEIEAISRKAKTIIEDEGIEPAQAVVEASKRIKATTQAIEFMTAIALAEIADSDLLPPTYRELWGDSEAVSQIIEATRPTNEIRAARS